MKLLLALDFALTLWLLVPVAQAQTPFGNAITFNGTNQYVAVASFGNIIPTNEITVEFWANTSVTTGQSAFILNPDQNNNRFNAHLNYGPPPAQGVTYWDFGDITGIGSGRLGNIAAPVNSIGNWVHYAFVASQSSNSMSIYTNGVLMATKTGMTPFVRGAYDLHIGGSSNYFSYHGTLDDFRVWNVARSQAQIQSDLGVPLTGSETNLVVYYRFDSTSGTVATNSATTTGAAYNGTLINGPTWVASGVSSASALNSVVTTNVDFGPGSLRQAVTNVFPGTTITFAPALSGQTITLTHGELLPTKNLTIDGSALPNGIAINGNAASGVFQIDNLASVVLTALTITNGKAAFGGGVLNNSSTLTLNRCTIAGNSATSSGGGGVGNNNGTTTLNQCTLYGNNAAFGGGGAILDALGLVNVFQCTIYGNTSSNGGGLSSADVVRITNSIVSGNSGGDLAGGGYLYDGKNLIGGNPMLAPLGNYGGPTPTMPPLPGSPAIDGCTNGASFTTDQRGAGYPRVMNFYADIGAVEALVPSIPNASFEVDLDYTNEPGYAAQNGGVITGWTISNTNRIGQSIGGSVGPFADNGAIPDGTNVAFIQSVGESNSLSTTMTGLNPGVAYVVIFRANCRSAYTIPVATWSLNGGAFVPFTAGPAVGGSNPYYTNSGSFMATSNTASLVLQNTVTNGDGTAVVDAFTIAPYQVIVTTTNDGGAGSLRAAVAQAPSGGTITFAQNLSGQTITLTNDQIVLGTSVTIDGSTLASSIQINGNGQWRIFQVNNGAIVTLNSLTITNGNGGYSGGGIYNGGTLTLNNCTVIGNHANGGGVYAGGGIDNDGTLTLNNCTITGNQGNGSGSAGGGGISDQGTLTVNNCTITGNDANNTDLGGGGILIFFGTLNLTNSIVCSNTASSGNNIRDYLGTYNYGNNLVDTNAVLGPLGNYGGPTKTMPPLAGSPAIDAGAPTTLTTDQRGYPRPVGPASDIGAVEGVYNPAGPGTLKKVTKLGNGSVQFGFTNYAGMTYTVLAGTNVAEPLNTWSNLGPAVEAPPGTFLFTDPQATNYPQRFYRVKGP